MRAWFWMSWMAAAALAACGGKVVLDTPKTGSGGTTGAGGMGGATSAPESTVFSSSDFSSSDFSSSDFASSTAFASSGDGVPSCATCGDILDGNGSVQNLCETGQSGLFYMNLVSCLCSGGCATPCAAICQGADTVPSQCRSCAVNSAGGGCVMQVQACEQDPG